MRIAVVLTLCAACAADSAKSGMTGPATLVVDNVPTAMSAGLFPAATTDGQNRPGYWGWTVGFNSAPPGDCHNGGATGELEVVTNMFSTSASDVVIPTGTMSIVKDVPVSLTNPVALVSVFGRVALESGSVTISKFTSETMAGDFSGSGTDSTNTVVTVTGTFSAPRCN